MAETYRVEVTMDGGPFQFDNSEPTILKGDELEKIIEQSGGRAKVEKKTKKEQTASGTLAPAPARRD